MNHPFQIPIILPSKPKTLFALTAMFLLFQGCASRTESSFMRQCERSGGNSSVCSCMYDGMEERWGEDTLKRISLGEGYPEDFVPAMAQITAQCSQR